MVTDNRIAIRLNAFKAIAVITAAHADGKVREALHAQIGRAYKQEVLLFEDFKSSPSVPFELFAMRRKKKLLGDSSELAMNETAGL